MPTATEGWDRRLGLRLLEGVATYRQRAAQACKRVSPGLFLLPFAHCLFPLESQQSPWEQPAGLASVGAFYLALPGPQAATSPTLLGAQALRAGSQGYNRPPFPSDLLKPSLRGGERPSLCEDGQGHLCPAPRPCEVRPEAQGWLTEPCAHLAPWALKSASLGWWLTLGGFLILISFSVNMGRLIIINVKRFPSDEIVLKIS